MNYWTTLIVMVFALCVSFYRADRQDMRLCQIEHSFDTCFQALNR